MHACAWWRAAPAALAALQPLQTHCPLLSPPPCPQLMVVFSRPVARLCDKTWTLSVRAKNAAELWSDAATATFDAPACPPA